MQANFNTPRVLLLFDDPPSKSFTLRYSGDYTLEQYSLLHSERTKVFWSTNTEHIGIYNQRDIPLIHIYPPVLLLLAPLPPYKIAMYTLKENWNDFVCIN